MSRDHHDSEGRAATRSTERDAPAAMDGDTFRRAGHALVDSIADLLTSMPNRPVNRAAPPEEVRERLNASAPVPEVGEELSPLLERVSQFLFDYSLFNGHPLFLGYIMGAPAPIGMLADFLASAINANVTVWRGAPAGTEIESQTIRWIAELVGVPTSCGGLLVSGGNMANIVGLLVARAEATGGAVRQTGVNQETARLRAYASTETHTWLQKAADIAGIGTDSIRWIETDEHLHMDTAALSRAIERDQKAGDKPFLVVGTAGSVSTGAVDPLKDIAQICRDAGAWFHVDGAYGAFANIVEDAPPDLRFLGQADSVALDPHKWLYAPIEAGCVLVRDADKLLNTFTYRPEYYQLGEGDITNYFEFGPQNSRSFRALKVWLALANIGRSGYAKMIGDDMRLARCLHQLAKEHEELEAFTQELSVTTFRYVPRELRAQVGNEDTERYLNELNETLLEHIQLSGKAIISNAIIRGTYTLRACVVNFRTTEAHMDELVDIVVSLGRDVHARLQAR